MVEYQIRRAQMWEDINKLSLPDDFVEVVTIDSLDYWVQMDDGTTGAMYVQSNSYSGADIYIDSSDVAEDLRHAVLLNLVVQFDLYVLQGYGKDEALEAATIEDRLYAESHYTADQQQRLETVRATILTGASE